MEDHGGPEVEWFMLGGDGDCAHEHTALLGGDVGKNQYWYCDDCEGVLLRAEEGEDKALAEQREREERERRKRADPLGSVVDLFGTSNGSDGDGPGSWLASKLHRLFR